eukprot:m.69673 g.69673  ORF g.69673 m.69673 type:complete len:63 (+) comp13747_c0_seq3:48-236(+)
MKMPEMMISLLLFLSSAVLLLLACNFSLDICACMNSHLAYNTSHARLPISTYTLCIADVDRS